MKRFLLMVLLAGALAGLIPSVETLPKEGVSYIGVYIQRHAFALETERCPCGHSCRYGSWVPRVSINKGVWVFGVTSWDPQGGILHFRILPDRECTQHCFGCPPVLYTADVVYVPWYGSGEYPQYLPEDVPLTYIPPGNYIVTSPSFNVYHNTKIWVFSDDGMGPKKMNADLKTDKPRYGREDAAAVLYLQVKDMMGQPLKVDSITGEITLPDGTIKTLRDWSWNSEKSLYEYLWNFTNDQGVISNPKEGVYFAEVYVKKKYYEDTRASTTFSVCDHVQITLELDKREYSPGETVMMTVHCFDENGCPVNGEISSVLVLPDGQVRTDLAWTCTEEGTYTASYSPEQEGDYSITVGIKEEGKCYLEEASSTFTVEQCEDASLSLEISEPVIFEPVYFTLTVRDSGGTPLPGGEVDSELCLPDNTTVSLTWVDRGDGTYTAEYTPSLLGRHILSGKVTLPGAVCYKGFFDAYFTVTKKKLPDLVIRNEDITIEPEPHLGDTVTISVTVWNIGTKEAESFWVVILINDGVVYREFVGVLAPGSTVTIAYEWKVLYSGGFIIQVIADPPEGLT